MRMNPVHALRICQPHRLGRWLWSMGQQTLRMCVLMMMALATVSAQTPQIDERWAKDQYDGLLEPLQTWAQRGDAQAQFRLGYLYIVGRGGVVANEREAAAWFRPAAEQGHAGAQASLGYLLSVGAGVAKDEREAARWLKAAAEQGVATAQRRLADLLSAGRGVAANDAEAVRWYRKAADQGDVDAQASLGLMLGNGKGTPKDEAEAVVWMRKAADQGSAWAQNNLGVMLENGRGVLQDQQAANHWFFKSARAGYGWGQRNWGATLRDGVGVPADWVKAYAWLNLASVAEGSAHPDAANERDALAQRMNAAQVAEGQRLSRLWQPGQDLAKSQVAGRPSNTQSRDATSNDPYPARPPKKAGVISCNTNCANSACWRTYDDGRKVRVQARQTWNAHRSQFEWNAGPC